MHADLPSLKLVPQPVGYDCPPDDLPEYDGRFMWNGAPVQITYEVDYRGDVYVTAIQHGALILNEDELSRAALDELAGIVRRTRGD